MGVNGQTGGSVRLDELTPWLFSRTSGGIRWGLERTERLLAGVGDPHRRFRSLLIGGTNGKGSVAALCASAIARDSRRTVGLYTSPHLIDSTERIRVDGVPVTPDALVDAAERLRPAIEETGATFFEATTAMAFLLFAEAGVDFAVVEVGLGGRLDATNVLDAVAAGVTNVGLDHTEYLGDTLAEVAGEKAGIIKPGTPSIVGAVSPHIREVFQRRADEAGAPLVFLDEIVSVEATATGLGVTVDIDSKRWGARRLEIPLPGAHQATNAAFAAELLGLLPPDLRPSWEMIEGGFRTVRWPGRLQVERIRGTTWVFDVAHNPDGAQVLTDALDVMELPAPRVLVTGILADKDWRSMLSTLMPCADAAILTVPTSAPASRLWDPEEVARWSSESLGVTPRVIPSLESALHRASTLAPHGTIIVTGSIHTVGDAMDLLGIRAV